MPSVPAGISKLLPLVVTSPWKRAFVVATWLFGVGKKRLEENLTKKEREELTKLMIKSKGKPSNLTQRQRTRFRRLVNKAATGRFP
jgi:hypothetical protein